MRLNPFGYYVDFFVCLVILALQGPLLLWGARWQNGLEWSLCAVFGVVAWTIIEYAVHRWIYHRAPYFKDLHDAHHAAPDGFIGAPPFVGIGLIFLVAFAPFVMASWFGAWGLTTGMLVGYMGYMLVHHAAHHWQPRVGSWLYQLRRHHALHHHHSDEANFGVTTNFWDYVCGTMRVRPGEGRGKVGV